MEVQADDKLRQTLIHNQNRGPNWQTGVTMMMLQWLLTGSRRSPCSSHKYITELHQRVPEIMWRWYCSLQYSIFYLRRRLNSLKFKQLRGTAVFSSLRFQYIIDIMDINLRDLILPLFTTKKTHRQLHLNTWISTKDIKFISSYHCCRSPISRKCPISCNIWDCVQNKNIIHPVLEPERVYGYQTVLF